ncbi:hypothetical protein ACWC2T_12405 [Streptomyces sp. NPDC001393]
MAVVLTAHSAAQRATPPCRSTRRDKARSAVQVALAGREFIGCGLARIGRQREGGTRTDARRRRKTSDGRLARTAVMGLLRRLDAVADRGLALVVGSGGGRGMGWWPVQASGRGVGL